MALARDCPHIVVYESTVLFWAFVLSYLELEHSVLGMNLFSLSQLCALHNCMY